MALIVGVLLIPTALGLAKFDRDRDISELERALVAETDEHGGALESYFARARAIVLLTANSPAFANVLAEPGTRRREGRRQSRSLREVTHQLGYLEQLYPDSIGEACFIDTNGEEFARAVRGEIAQARRSVHRGGAGRLLRADLRARLRAGAPDAAVRLAGHRRMGRRERDADPAGRRPQARVRALRGDGGELPPRDGREQRRGSTATSYGSSTAAPARSSSTATAPQRIGAALGVAARRRVSPSSPAKRRSARRHRGGRAPDRVPPHRPAAGNANDWIVVAPAPRRRPAASSRASGRCRSRCSRSRW